MSPDVAAHVRCEALLADALRAAEPFEALQRAADDPALSPDLAAALRAADGDGVRLAALLIAKLRFERLLRGSERAAAWFERDPAAFTVAFRSYHRAVRPAAFWPAEEAAAFEAWSATRREP